jgi:hypothetical protein
MTRAAGRSRVVVTIRMIGSANVHGSPQALALEKLEPALASASPGACVDAFCTSTNELISWITPQRHWSP